VIPEILCVGESLTDVLPSGQERCGGAPANAAFHAAVLQPGNVALVSRIGDDARGGEIRAKLQSAGVVPDWLQVDLTKPTGTVQVSLRDGVPTYQIDIPAAWDFIESSEMISRAADNASVVVLGTLAQRCPVSRGTIRSLVERSRASGAVAIADLNLRAPFIDEEVVVWTLRRCDVLKLSREELAVVSGMLGARGDDEALFAGLVCEFALPRAVLTCGAEGAWFFDNGCRWHQPAIAAAVVDTVGAGDAFTAVLAAALAANIPLAQAAPAAAELASHVVSQPGAMPALPECLREKIRKMLDAPA